MIDLPLFQSLAKAVASGNEEAIKQTRYDIMFRERSYSSYGFDINPFDIAYRSETKEEYYVDLAYGLFKIGTALSSGGVLPAAQTAVGYTLDLIT